MGRRNWDDVAEDVTFMLDHGEHPDNAAKRAGFKHARSLEDVLYKHGFPELARRVHVYQDRSGNEEWKRLSRRLEAWLVAHEDPTLRTRVVS